MCHNCISTLTHAITGGYYQSGKYSWKPIILVYVSAYWIFLGQASVC